MSVASLPPNLQSKLDVLGRRLRQLRVLRGSSWAMLTLIAGAGAAIGLDAALELPPAVRCIISAVWLTVVALVVWRELIRPLRRRATAAGLAAAVEEEYPRLGERLTSAVELADADDTHGSPAFVRLLMRETDHKTRSLDFRRAAPPNAAEWLTATTVAAVLIFAAPLVFIPEYYLGLGRRLLMPWDRRPAIMPFAINITPGDGFAARGRPLTIGVEFQPTRERAALPDACTLVMTGEDGKPIRLRMPAARPAHAFAFRIDELKGNIRYYIEVGRIETESRAIIAVDPVELAGGPKTTLAPPAYARALGVQTMDAPNDLTVLEYGRVTIDCRFDRPAESATLIVTPTSGDDRTPLRRPLVLAEDRQSGRIDFPARAGAKLRLELAASHGITTLTPEQALSVSPDRPPEFRRAAGLPDHVAVRPTDTLALDLIVTDDLAVAAVEVEYQVNDGPIQHQPIALAGLGSPQAAGRADFSLTGKVKEGDTLRIRLRAADNRDVPEAKLGPNFVTYPPGDHWSELRVSANAASVRQQDVTARRDDIEQRLRDLISRVDRAERRTSALYQSIEQERAGADEQAQVAGELTAEQADLSKTLEALADDTALAGLQPLADAMQAVGEQEFRQAAEAFRDAGIATNKARVPPLRRADAALAEVRKKLEALLEENRDLADARLAQVVLDELAEREKQLADQTKETISPEQRDRLSKEQQQIADELKTLTENDAALRAAMRAALSDNVRQLAEQARKLAQAERDLDAQLAAAQRQRNAARLTDLARQQEQLAADADRLAKQTQNSARTVQTPPLDPQPAQKAAVDLRSSDADEALHKQDLSARELDRIAEKLQQGVETANDPREAAKQLARLQEENRKRLDRPAENALARQQQDALRRAAADVKVPEDNAVARRERQQAAELAAEASRALTRGNSADADFRMGQAKDALDRLASALPAAESRPPRARDEPSKPRENQEGMGRPANLPLPDGVPSSDQVAQARQMADRQRELREKVRQATGADSATADERSAANRQQRDMAQKAGEVGRSLNDSAGQLPGDQARQSARDAAASARQGELSLQQASGTDSAQAKQARKRAADSLDRAAVQAEKAAGGDSGKSQNGSPKVGQQLQTAKGEMNQAQKRLGEGQSQPASGSMRKAADALQEAAKELGQQGPPDGATLPAEAASPGTGTPTARDLPKELQKYAGKKWGELPGELRTQMVQDIKAQYGDDYGRIIKLYFEQIAENNGKK